MKDVKTLYSTPGSFGAGSGKSCKSTPYHKGKSFGYQVLGFGSGGDSGPAFVEATGGNASFTVGDYKIHVFTGDGNLCVTSQGTEAGNNKIDYLVIAGGGGGGPATGGGGGGGGYRESQAPGASPVWTASPIATCASLTCFGEGALPVTVGAGGATFCSGAPTPSQRGANSVFSGITSTGGGAGGSPHTGSPSPGGAAWQPGGSGGGAGYGASGFGLGNTPPVSPAQGQNGGPGSPTTGGGGGGALNAAPGITGGGGASTTIAPSAYGEPSCATYWYSGGGGGGTDQDPGRGGGGGAGGKGGGGRGGDRHPGGPNPRQGEAGDANTGGGGGGLGLPTPGTGNNGGSGIVVIRYKYQ